MGGHLAGEVASTLALEPVAALDQMDPARAAGGIADAVRKSNRAVFEKSQTDASLKGMGTTLTAIAVHDGTAHLAHVGDSRCYLVRGDSISQLSRDHTLVARMVDEGKLTPEQAEAHPQRSILTRALGAERDVDVDTSRIALQPGDRLVLCSDGLTTVLVDDEIRRLASDGADLDAICGAMVDEANARGGPDNVTAVVVEVGGTLPPRARSARGGASRRGARVLRRMPARLIAWVAILTALSAGAIVGVRAWADRSYYVGIAGDRVAVYRGLPVRAIGLSLSRVKEPTDIAAADVADWLRPQLEEGIRAPSLTAARRVVEERIRPNARPSPGSPSPSPSPTPTTERTR